MTTANRGKYAEAEFRKWAKARSDADKTFAFHRHPDPHSGSLQTAPADFEVMWKAKHHLIEIKQVDHTHLLPKKNFAGDKIARMRKFEWAGSRCIVMVYFTPLKMWRTAPLEWFDARKLEKGSWDMSEFPLVKLQQLVAEMESV